MIKVIFFDIDGTLIDNNTGLISTSSKEAIALLQAKGVKCVAATGRHINELNSLATKDIMFDGYLTLNGSLTLDKQKQVIIANPFDAQQTQEIINVFQSKAYPLVLVEEKGLYINYIDNKVITTQKAIKTELPPIETYKGCDVFQATTFVDKNQQQELERILVDLQVVRWNQYGVDIISKNQGKSQGIKSYLDYYHISLEETMAFGDSDNDLSMLSYVNVAIAMGNSNDGVKKVCDYVTDSVTNEGVYKALKHFNLV